jgi:hypothetical protein
VCREPQRQLEDPCAQYVVHREANSSVGSFMSHSSATRILKTGDLVVGEITKTTDV